MAYLKWKELDKIRYAAVVHPVNTGRTVREVTLVSLGCRPRLTSEIMWRVGYRFPGIKVDWGRIFLELMAEKAELSPQEKVRVHYYEKVPPEDRERIERAAALFRFKNRRLAPRLDHPKLVEWRKKLEMSSFEEIDGYLAMIGAERDRFFRDFYADYARYFNEPGRRVHPRITPPPVSPTPWHSLLGLKGNENLAAIKRRYRDLAKMYHPDINREGGDRMREINAAYRELVLLAGDGYRPPGSEPRRG